MKSFKEHLEENKVFQLVEDMYQLNYDPQDFAKELFERAMAEEQDAKVRQEIGELYVEFMKEIGNAFVNGWDAIKQGGRNFMHGWNRDDFSMYPKAFHPVVSQMMSLKKTIEKNPHLAKSMTPILTQMQQSLAQSAQAQTAEEPAAEPGAEEAPAATASAKPVVPFGPSVEKPAPPPTLFSHKPVAKPIAPAPAPAHRVPMSGARA